MFASALPRCLVCTRYGGTNRKSRPLSNRTRRLRNESQLNILASLWHVDLFGLSCNTRQQSGQTVTSYPGGKRVPSGVVVACPGEIELLEALNRRRPHVCVQTHGLHRLALDSAEVARVGPNLPFASQQGTTETECSNPTHLVTTL